MVPPTNRYTVVLRKIIQPVPMVVRDMETILPALGRPCGFDHLLFRVRSLTNAEGRVVSAYRGWIEGPVRSDGRIAETMWMGFKYHINPNPQSRSLEPK